MTKSDTQADSASCCGGTPTASATSEDSRIEAAPRMLHVELLVIDLATCARCVPTGSQLREALELVTPLGDALGIRLDYRETIVETAEEAKARALLSSPTIRFNGRDIAQDIRESECESCGDLTDNNTSIDCREWHYRGRVYTAAPVPFLVEKLMEAMLELDQMPAATAEPLAELPANLQLYFANKKAKPASSCCG